MKRSAVVGLAVAAILAAAFPVGAAQRTVLAEMFGATWCGHCPKAREALWNLQEEYGEDSLVVLYFHVNDMYATSETMARASYYFVGGIPEVDFDSGDECIGASTVESVQAVYKSIIDTRLAVETPITIKTTGMVNDPSARADSSWVTAVFTAADAVTYGDLTAQFIVYENISELYPFTVRDMLPSETISTLSSPGDSVVITKKFVANAAWNVDELRVAVFLEDRSQPLIVNAQIMPDPYHNAFTHTDHYASEIALGGDAVYQTILKNTGIMNDVITVDIAHDTLPPGVGQWDWLAHYYDSSGVPHYGPWGCALEAGQSETLEVHIDDVVGTMTGMAVTTLSATSQGDPDFVSVESYATFVNTPSILIVDDDAGQSHESHLQTAVADTGYSAFTWDADTRGRPTLAMLNSFWAVLWTTANGSADYLGGGCENNMAAYLEGGGNLMLASMDFLSSRVNTLAFRTDYLHIDSWTDDTGGFVVNGVMGDQISHGLSLSLAGGPFLTNYSDSFTRTTPADTILSSPVGAKALKVEENDHKVVFLSFPFENVSTVAPAPDNQKGLIGRILDWFGSTVGVEGGQVHRCTLGQNYPNPFNPVTRLAYTVPEGGGRVTLRIHNINGQVVKTLVDANMPAGPAVAVWNGVDESGRSLASGVYFARLQADGRSSVRKITLLK